MLALQTSIRASSPGILREARGAGRLHRCRGRQIAKLSEQRHRSGRSDRARSYAGMAGQDLAKEVSVKRPYQWNEGSWRLARSDGTAGFVPRQPALSRGRVRLWRQAKHLAIDSRSWLSHFDRSGADSHCSDVLKLNPDGVFLANGPGDPEPCEYAVEATREFVARKVPTFGICLGPSDPWASRSGARTLKMKFGHHGANHPVLDVDTRKVYITSQNHGFAVDEKTLPANARITHVSLFDGSLQGFELTDAPAFCFQGHPEASPGPHDICDLFDRFIELIARHAGSTERGRKRFCMTIEVVKNTLNEALGALQALTVNECDAAANCCWRESIADTFAAGGRVLLVR